MVGAHPDDPEFAFGGSLAGLIKAGASAAYVICTDGSQGGEDPHQPDNELVETRRQEQLAAARVLGVGEVRFLGLPDGQLHPDLELRRAITAEIRRFKPDLVLTHNPVRALSVRIGASHPDHLAVGEATMAAVYPDARNPRAFRELLGEGLEAHKVAEVWIAGHAEPNHFVDVGEFLDVKVEAILSHRSQFLGRPDFDSARFRSEMLERMRQLGEKAGCEYAEAFFRIETA